MPMFTFRAAYAVVTSEARVSDPPSAPVDGSGAATPAVGPGTGERTAVPPEGALGAREAHCLPGRRLGKAAASLKLGFLVNLIGITENDLTVVQSARGKTLTPENWPHQERQRDNNDGEQGLPIVNAVNI